MSNTEMLQEIIEWSWEAQRRIEIGRLDDVKPILEKIRVLAQQSLDSP